MPRNVSIEEIRAAVTMVAIDTPFSGNGEINLPALCLQAEELIAAGVQGFIVAGTTGCGHLLDWEEHLMLISYMVRNFGDQVIIVGNTGSNTTREEVKATQRAFAMTGMHASLLIGPYYGKVSQDATVGHIMPCLNYGPAIIYNVPTRGHSDILPQTMERISHHRNFVGAKECQGVERIRQLGERGISAWSGNDDQAFEARHQAGSLGVISVAGNIVPGLMRQLMDDPEAIAVQERLLPLMNWLFPEGYPNPHALKTALPMLGHGAGNIRRPYEPLPETLCQQGLEILGAFAPEERVGNTLRYLERHEYSCII